MKPRQLPRTYIYFLKFQYPTTKDVYIRLTFDFSISTLVVDNAVLWIFSVAEMFFMFRNNKFTEFNTLTLYSNVSKSQILIEIEPTRETLQDRANK